LLINPKNKAKKKKEISRDCTTLSGRGASA